MDDVLGKVSLRGVAVTIATLLALMVLAGVAQAATYTVNSTTDAPLKNPAGKSCVSTAASKCTLRAAVQAADNGGGASTVVLGAGTYKFTLPSTGADDPSTGDLDVNTGVTLTVKGLGASRTIIDPNHIDRAFTVQAPSGALTVEDLTITRGDAGATAGSTDLASTDGGDGGAIVNSGKLSVIHAVLSDDSSGSIGGAITALDAATSTKIVDSQLSNDYAASAPGGAVADVAGTLTLSGSSFDHDVSYDADGGAVFMATDAHLTVSGSGFLHDRAYAGGAIFDGSAPAKITRSEFSDNSLLVPGDGGALVLDDPSSTDSSSIKDSTFSGNSGATAGGAVHVESDGPVTLDDDAFSNNTALADGGTGGALMDTGDGAMTLENSIFTGNEAGTGGGLMLASAAGGTATVIGSTIVDSFAVGDGGGVYVGASDSVTLERDTIADNAASIGGGLDPASILAGVTDTLVADNSGGDCSAVAGAADQGHNLDSDGSCFGTLGTPEATGDLVNRNAKLGPLTNNGGPLDTLALRSGSPAIGTGACGLSGVTKDARGVTLPASKCDIGAFQTADSNLGVHLSHGKPRLHHKLTLHFAIANAGPGPSLGTKLLAKLPKHVKLISAHASRGRCAGHATVSCTIGTLNSTATGGSNTASVTLVIVPTHEGRSQLTASVSSSSTDPIGTNNHATLQLKLS